MTRCALYSAENLVFHLIDVSEKYLIFAEKFPNNFITFFPIFCKLLRNKELTSGKIPLGKELRRRRY